MKTFAGEVVALQEASEEVSSQALLLKDPRMEDEGPSLAPRELLLGYQEHP